MKLCDKQNTYQNHNYKVKYKKDGKLKSYTYKKSACFFSLKSYFEDNQKGKSALIYSNSEFTQGYTDDEIKLYCELVNKIPFVKFRYSKKGDTHFFLIDYKDYDSINKLVATAMIIRYLWENNGVSGMDMYYKVPGYFIKLVEKYPEEDLLYLLLWANFSITDHKGTTGWNSNHSLITSNFKYPFKFKDLKWHEYSVNCTFTVNTKFNYNKTVEEYKQELKDFKIFENE